MNAPYVQFKDYDHEEVENDFTADYWLRALSGVILAIAVFAILMFSIVVMMQIPDRWITDVLLLVGGV